MHRHRSVAVPYGVDSGRAECPFECLAGQPFRGPPAECPASELDDHRLVRLPDPEVAGVGSAVHGDDLEVSAVLLAVLAHGVDQAQRRLGRVEDGDPRQRGRRSPGHCIADRSGASALSSTPPGNAIVS
jgi:hypothetical protein